MIKKQKTYKGFHSEPATDLEKFLVDRIPVILEAYGLGKISFNFITIPKESECGIPEDGLLAIKYEEIYKTAYITITDNAEHLYRNKQFKPLTDGLVHEVAHIVTNKLANLAENRHTTKKQIHDTVEETTESVAQVARALLAKMDPVRFNFN